MVFDTRRLTLALSLTALTNCLPFNGVPRAEDLVQRTRSYAIVNVDGGSTAPVEITTTLVQPTTAVVTIPPITTSSSSASTTTTSSRSTSRPPDRQPLPSSSPTTRPTSNIVTVIVTETATPTEFYDDGMWHTRYPVKNFEEGAPTTTSLSNTQSHVSTTVPTPVLVHSYNQTGITTSE